MRHFTIHAMLIFSSAAFGMQRIAIATRTVAMGKSMQRVTPRASTPFVMQKRWNLYWYDTGKKEGYDKGYYEATEIWNAEKFRIYRDLIIAHNSMPREEFDKILKQQTKEGIFPIIPSIKKQLENQLAGANKEFNRWFSDTDYWRKEISRIQAELKKIDEFIERYL